MTVSPFRVLHDCAAPLTAGATLLNHGATVDKTNAFGNTPLFIAVSTRTGGLR